MADEKHFLKCYSSIAFLPAPAQDARELLFGPISSFHRGDGKRSAKATGRRDIGLGADLSQRSLIRIRIDDRPPQTIDCAGATPSNTTPSEITAAINNALSAPLASHNGQFISLASAQEGPAGRLEFELLPAEQDATEIIFGFPPRTFHGSAATSARLVGAVNLEEGVDLGARNKLKLVIDGAQSKQLEIDLRARANEEEAKTKSRADKYSLRDMAKAINDAFGQQIAADDGKHLIIASPSDGSVSRITLEPLETTRRRRFVTRAFVSDEAGPKLFGFATRQAQGSSATHSRLIGSKDLSRGVDLRTSRFLRLKIDGRGPVEIDCAGTRSRATELKEIIKAINAGLGIDPAQDRQVASSPDNKLLALTSPSTGAASGIAFEEPRGVLTRLHLEPGIYRGSNGAGINFVSLVDLEKGVDLSAGGKIKLGINGKDPIEIDCAKPGDPQHTRLDDITGAINKAFVPVGGPATTASIAAHDFHFITIKLAAGADAKFEFAKPASGDATQKIFGIAAPRVYRGAEGSPARVASSADLSAGVDLRAARMLRIAINGDDPVDVDCSALATALAVEGNQLPPDPRAAVNAVQIATAIKQQISGVEVKAVNNRLVIETLEKGAATRLDLLPFPGDDARQTLFGKPEATAGEDATPARITGEADLIAPVNLAARGVIKVAVNGINGGRPIEIEVAGSAPASTVLAEVVSQINAIVPGLAEASQDNRLVLTSPTAGDASSLELLPTAAIELIEFPLATTIFPPLNQPPLRLRHGDPFTVSNDGAAESDVRIEIRAPQGSAQPALFNRTTGWIIKLKEVLLPGEQASVWSDGDGTLHASINDSTGVSRQVERTHIAAAPLSPHATVPFTDPRRLARNEEDGPRMLQLHNPLASAVLTLRARDGASAKLAVVVAEAKPPAPSDAPAANGQQVKLIGRVAAEATVHWPSYWL